MLRDLINRVIAWVISLLQRIGSTTTTTTIQESQMKPNQRPEVCGFDIEHFNQKKRTEDFFKNAVQPHLTEEQEQLLSKRNNPGKGKGKNKTTTTSTTKAPTNDSTTSSTTQSPSTTSSTTKAPGTYNAVILLDFDGHTVTGTPWNFSGSIVCAPSGLLDSEKVTIINNVIDDYSPYKVTVTTDEALYNAAPMNRRVRCIITETNEWFGNNAGGVAYRNSFTWGDNTPCFVFSKLLGYNTKYIMEATSHEVGHTLGLNHQSSYDANCVKTSDYNYGCCGEAPIMGVGYYQPTVRWWIGPTPYGCNTVQDDDAIITALLGKK